MFSLYRGLNAKTEEYHLFAGNKYNVKRQITSKNLIKPDLIFEISSELEVINELKANVDVKNGLDYFLKQKTEDYLSKFKHIVLLKFLSLHNCEPSSLKICRECGQMMDMVQSEVIGHTTLNPREIGRIIGVNQNWACKECRIEFAVITWQDKNSQIPAFDVLNAKRKEIRYRIKELLHDKYSEVKLTFNISPSVDDYKVVLVIRKCFEEQKRAICYGLPNEELIVKRFISYHAKLINSIRFCVKCCHFLKNHEDLGSVLYDAEKIRELLGNDIGWVCSICGELPSIVLYSINPNKYFMELNFIKSNDKIALKNMCKNSYICLELYARNLQAMNKLVKNLQKEPCVSFENGNISVSNTKFDLVTTVIELFIASITESVKKFAVCKNCHHIYDDRNNELGYFWVTKYLPPLTFICQNHEVRSILYWNMTGWKTLDKLKFSQRRILDNADILVLSETHLVLGMSCDLEDHFPDRFSVKVEADKRSAQGRGSGGLMFLVRKSLICSATRLEFSNKGVFVKIQFTEVSYIIGGIYWKPEPGEDESLDDWISELDNFLCVYKKRAVKFIIGGDFNGRIKEDDSYARFDIFKNTAMGKARKSEDKTGNKRGRLLLALMKKHELVLCNGRTRSDKIGRITSKTVNGESVVDYVWVSIDLVPQVTNMAVVDVHSEGSDYHRGLLLELGSAAQN